MEVHLGEWSFMETVPIKYGIEMGVGLLSSSNPILIRHGMGVWKAIRANWDSLNRFIKLDIR